MGVSWTTVDGRLNYGFNIRTETDVGKLKFQHIQIKRGKHRHLNEMQPLDLDAHMNINSNVLPLTKCYPVNSTAKTDSATIYKHIIKNTSTNMQNIFLRDKFRIAHEYLPF
jgi:hypothetical protein